MGKKIALGCLGVFAVVVIGGGFFAYQYVAKPMMGSISALENIHEKNTQISNQSSYTPPANRELEEAQVERFVNVQREIREGLENVLAEFQDKYEDLGEEWEERDPSIREMMNVWGDLVGMYSGAKQVQVDALNNANFSLEEYRYVQQSFYQALGVELFSYNIDQIAKAASEGNFDFDMEQFEETQRQMDEVPQRNRDLVAPYADSAEDWVVFAWWGL
ncbi:MAG: hypothetical protein JJU13_04515 [Balneolaceae bacterium]|nr:hypothetical protein [Balneolaceae bacterium]